MWHFPGSPDFLKRQAKRLGLDKHKLDHVRACQNSPDLYTLSGIIGQLCQRYRERLTPEGQPLSEPELKNVAATLDRCELEVRKLHLTAASADDMLGEAYYVFNLPRKRNPFEIFSDYDAAVPITPITPVQKLRSAPVEEPGITQDAPDDVAQADD